MAPVWMGPDRPLSIDGASSKIELGGNSPLIKIDNTHNQTHLGHDLGARLNSKFPSNTLAAGQAALPKLLSFLALP